jgi:hypothetical protein
VCGVRGKVYIVNDEDPDDEGSPSIGAVLQVTSRVKLRIKRMKKCVRCYRWGVE